MVKQIYIIILFFFSFSYFENAYSFFDGDYKLEIIGTKIEEKNTFCSDFKLSKEQVKSFFKKAKVISFVELNQEYDWLPCLIYGNIFNEKGRYEWEIRLIGIGKLITPNKQVIWFGCKKSCNDMF